LLEKRIINQYKYGLSDALAKFKKKKKQTDFTEFFKSVDFRAAINEINSLAWNSGVKEIPPIDLVRFIRRLLPHYGEGMESATFNAMIFSFFRKDKLTDYKRKIRENGIKRIFRLVAGDDPQGDLI